MKIERERQMHKMSRTVGVVQGGQPHFTKICQIFISDINCQIMIADPVIMEQQHQENVSRLPHFV